MLFRRTNAIAVNVERFRGNVVERAKRYITECRDIHKSWLRVPGCLAHQKLTGSRRWHRLWILRYNLVLEQLARLHP